MTCRAQLSSQRIHRNEHFSLGLSAAANAFLNRLEHIGGIVAHATLAAHARGDVFNEDVTTPDLAMQGDAPFRDLPTTALAGFAFPKAHATLSHIHGLGLSP